MNYLKKINKKYNIINLLFNSIVFASAIILIDYYNLLSYMFLNYKYISIVICIIIVALFLKELVNNKLWNLISMNNVNYFDKMIIILFVSLCILLGYYSFIKSKYIMFSLIFLMILLIILLLRLCFINKSKKVNKTSSIYNLFDLYNNKIEKNDLILIEETSLINEKKDLLNMELFVSNLEDTLLQCNPSETYIISLTGKWGSGKTSIINVLSNRINNSKESIIGIFSPWKYDNKISLFKGFYSFICKSYGKKYGGFSYNNPFKKYEKIIINTIQNKSNIFLDSVFDKNINDEIDELKDDINDIIKCNNKKIIVVIDDIDRLDKEQIIFVFKAVKTLLNFENIVYILCYDEERIKKVFEKELKVDSDYLKKIIQCSVNVPQIEPHIIVDIGTNCIINLLSIYNIVNYDKEQLQQNLELIFSNFNDLRDVIRFINLITISIKNCYKINLNVCDFIALEYIKFSDFNLYNLIFNNSVKFISQDREKNYEYDWDIDKTFNEKTKIFYNEIFKDKKNTLELIANVFPYVNNYKNDYEIRSHYQGSLSERNETILSNRCCNGRYFSCFFTIRNSFFTELNKLLDDFICHINEGENIEKEFDRLIEEINPNNHDLLFELMEIKLNEINNKNYVFDYIFNNINKFEDKPRFLSLTSHGRANILLAGIISNEKDYEIQKKYLDKVFNVSLMIFNNILYWLGTDKYYNDQMNEIINYGKKILCDKLNEFINSNTNIFNKDKYIKHFCWLFIKNIDNKDDVKKYFNNLIDKNNIFRVLSEAVECWTGSSVEYKFNKNSLEELVNIDNVDKILSDIDYKLNKEQEKILLLYKSKDESNGIVSINYEDL